MINILALIVSLSLIMYLAYKGYSTIITAPIIGLITLLLTYGFNSHFMVNYTEIYMSGFANFVKNYFLSTVYLPSNSLIISTYLVC